MDLLPTHLQESARRAAGSFLSPLTNAIGEQRRLVDSLMVVSKVRVEECKHMMVWSKSQNEDVGEVLLKLNLLIRKLSDYELQFGTQYEGFREKIKYLRTKDDSLCEMGRRQADLQQKIIEAGKSHFRGSSKVKTFQKELDTMQKESSAVETSLEKLKKQLVKDAYTLQLNAIIELGRKMQIIGEHGKQLLDHIGSPANSEIDGMTQEDVLHSARISLETWSQMIMVNANTVLVHPPAGAEGGEGDADSDPELEILPSPVTPTTPQSIYSLKSSSTVGLALTLPDEAMLKLDTKEPQSPTPSVKSTASTVTPPTPTASTPTQATAGTSSTLSASSVSNLAPKLTLTPNRAKAKKDSTTPDLPPRNSDWASEATEAITGVKPHAENGLDGKLSAEMEAFRKQEEEDLARVLALSLKEQEKAAEAAKLAAHGDNDDLKLTAEELRFVMGDGVPKRSSVVVKKKIRSPESVAGDDEVAVSTLPSKRASNVSKRSSTASTVSVAYTSADDDETPVKDSEPRRPRGPQAAVIEEGEEMVKVSSQGPRPWVQRDETQPILVASPPSKVTPVAIDEELASSGKPLVIPEELPHAADHPSTKKDHVHESIGPEPTYESMGPEPTLESMGSDGSYPANQSAPVQHIAMPSVPDLEHIRQQKILATQRQAQAALYQQQQYQQQQQFQSQQQQFQPQSQQSLALSPELQYLNIANSPQSMHQQLYSPTLSSAHPGSPGFTAGQQPIPSPRQVAAQLANYQTPIPYKPATKYVPSPSNKQSNRMSGSHSPTGSGRSSPQPHHQQQFSGHQQYPSQQQQQTYSHQYIQQQQMLHLQQQQKQLNDFYYTPYEQQYQQAYQQQQGLNNGRSDSVSTTHSTASLAPIGWILPGTMPPTETPMQTPQLAKADPPVATSTAAGTPGASTDISSLAVKEPTGAQKPLPVAPTDDDMIKVEVQ